MFPSPPHYPRVARLHFPAFFPVHINVGSDGHVIDNLRIATGPLGRQTGWMQEGGSFSLILTVHRSSFRHLGIGE